MMNEGAAFRFHWQPHFLFLVHVQSLVAFSLIPK